MPPEDSQHEADPSSAAAISRYTGSDSPLPVSTYTATINSALLDDPRSSVANKSLSQAYYQRAKGYVQQGRYRDAMKDVREYIKLKPEHYQVSSRRRVAEELS